MSFEQDFILIFELMNTFRLIHGNVQFELYYKENFGHLFSTGGIYNIFVKLDRLDIFKISIDSRTNMVNIIYSNSFNNEITYNMSEYIKNSFNKLKDSDFRYRIGDGYEGTKKIDAEIFINFLKTENRDSILNEVLK